MSLEKRLQDSVYDGIGNLQDIAEEMFARFYVSSSTAAEEKAKNRILMQEIQRLMQEIQRLKQENEKLDAMIGKMATEMEKNGNPSVGLEADSSLCTREPLEPVKCPKCGSMDVATNCLGRKGLCACNVCAEVFEVK